MEKPKKNTGTTPPKPKPPKLTKADKDFGGSLKRNREIYRQLAGR